MEIYINTSNCIIQNNYGLLPTLDELDKIIGEFKKMRKQILKIDNIENFNSNKINEYLTEYNINEKIYKKTIKNGYIYIIKSGEYYKIGKTINLKDRIKKYITENPNNIEIIHTFKTDNYTQSETELHNKFKNKKHNREWFLLNEEDILFLKTL